jgi:magnesium chelatase subunit H
MHGTVEWLPGQPLGNDRKVSSCLIVFAVGIQTLLFLCLVSWIQSWSDELLGDLPNIYIYAANNPSGTSHLWGQADWIVELTAC